MRKPAIGPVSIAFNPLFILPGQEVLVADRGGFSSTSKPITITTSGGANFDGDTSLIINSPYGRVRLVYDGTTFGVM